MNRSAEATVSAPLPASSAAAPLPHARPRGARLARRRGLIRNVALALIGAAVLGWGGRFAIHAFHYEETDDAFVAGRLHTVSPQVEGQVTEVLVDDNQVVHAGDVLARLDPVPFKISLQKAQAALAQAQAQERQLSASAQQADAAAAEARARVSQAEAQQAQAAAQAELAKANLARAEQLGVDSGAMSKADLDQARSAAKAADAARQAADANLAAARASVISAESAQVSAHAQCEAAHASVAVADAARRDAERTLSYTTIVAPTDGRIGNKHVETGNRVQAGQPLFALAESDVWVVANFKETQLAKMHPGDHVDLEVDAIPDVTLHGTLQSLAPASGAQFALLPPDNSTGNFNKVVQRVPVKILLDADTRRALGDRLRLGLSVMANVRVR